MVPSRDLEAAYASLSQALYSLLIRDDLPRTIGHAIFRFHEEVRSSIDDKNTHQIEALALRETLQASLITLSKADTNCSEVAKMEDAHERVFA